MALPVIIWIILATVVNSLAAFIGIFSLWMNDKALKKILMILVAFSAGALMGGALLHLAAEAIGMLEANTVFLVIIIGFSVFFLMERFLYWHHCHDGVCDVHPYTYLILFGDGMHNFIDGLVIAASFIVNPVFGAVTTLIIISHELPQELGNFGVLVHGGMKKKKALFYNFLSQLTSVAGGIIGYIISDIIGGFQPLLLSFAAGGFIYIAASDLIPELHKEVNKKKSIASFVFFITGIAFMYAIKLVFGG